MTGVSFTCNKCPPGTHLRKHCTKDSRTECGPCPKSHYTEIWNYIERCQYCNIFCTDDQFVSVQCTQFHNRKCECKDGFYMRHGSCSRHRRCPPGEGVISNGRLSDNVWLPFIMNTPFPLLFFQLALQTTAICLQIKYTFYDQYPYFPGTAHTDVKCEPCPVGFFSAESSSRKTCQKFSVCAPGRTTIPGNDMNDVYCSACRTGSRTHEGQNILSILFSLL